MNVYADICFYLDRYLGKEIPFEKYEKAALVASQYIRKITLGRSDDYVGDEVKYATCAVIEAYAETYNLTGGNNSAGQIKSESTDGYSVSYVSQIKEGESKEELFRRKAYLAAYDWLQGTGLLDRRVGCSYANKYRLHNL